MHLENATFEMQMLAVQQNGKTLMLIGEKSLELCLAAIKNNGRALKYIHKNQQTIQLCMEAVKQNCKAIQYIKIMSLELYIELNQYLSTIDMAPYLPTKKIILYDYKKTKRK